MDESANAPISQGRRSLLVPVTSHHYDFLYNLETSPGSGYRWRFRGTTPSPERAIHSLWEGVLATYLVLHRASTTPVGVVTAYSGDMRNRHAFVAVTTHPSAMGSGITLEALTLFIDYCFTLFDLRKLYAETLEFIYKDFRSGAPNIFHEEGRLFDHEYYAGRYWDKIFLSIAREQWNEGREQYLNDATSLSTVQDAGSPLSQEAFLDVVSANIGQALPPESLTALLEEDLDLDSLARYRLLVAVERVTGVALPDEMLSEVRTLADFYAFYRSNVYDRP